MIQLKNILVPSDFSECSEAAVRYGVALSRAFGATLHLLHVVQDPYTQPWAAEAFPASLGDVLEDWEQHAAQQLRDSVPEQDREHVVIACTVASPFAAIVSYAKQKDIDLIVLGTHGRGPVSHMLLGSIAEKVVRRAPCPVLTVRHPQHEFITDEDAAAKGVPVTA